MTDTVPHTVPAGRTGERGSGDTGGAPAEATAHLLETPLRAALERLDPQTRHWCGYHLGLWDRDGGPGPGGGKGIRMQLALLSARAAGAPAERGVPAAVACELVHNFSLLHDDVMDGDRERRHRPTVWATFGTSSAILAGDALLALANEVLAEAAGPTVAWAVRCLNGATRRLVAGQCADLAFEAREEVGLEECLRMAGDKTAALLSCAASLGVVLVDGPAALALGLAEYGEHLGLAFQITDDLLGIWGTTERTGKPVWADLRARKKSLPVVAALASGTPAARRLAAQYAEEDTGDPARLEQLAGLVEEAGGRAWAERAAAEHSRSAVSVLQELDLPGPVRHELLHLTDKLSRRDY